ncbi:MAG: hypothetical protein HW416_2769, partial [Chloroflexi bacterium]|nr:hypothetical protein [Chloroflexota bacterium]
MALLIRPDEHEGILDLLQLTDALEEAYKDWGRDPSINARRSIMSGGRRLAVHQASAPSLRRTGLTSHTRVSLHEGGTGADLEFGRYHAASAVF